MNWRLQISTEKAIEVVTDQARNWPVMVAVTVMLSAGVVSLVTWLWLKDKKMLQERQEKELYRLQESHLKQIDSIIQMHRDNIVTLQKELAGYRDAIRDMTQAILDQKNNL